MFTRDIREFSEGLTVIGGWSPYEVSVAKNIIEITKVVKFNVQSKKEIIEETRKAFNMPEKEYPLLSILTVKKGIRMKLKRGGRDHVGKN